MRTTQFLNTKTQVISKNQIRLSSSKRRFGMIRYTIYYHETIGFYREEDLAVAKRV